MYPGPECPYCERVPGKLTFGDPVADLRKPWWETMTETSANETLARYDREAQQTQSLAVFDDCFCGHSREIHDQRNRCTADGCRCMSYNSVDPTDDEAFWDANQTPADDRW